MVIIWKYLFVSHAGSYPVPTILDDYKVPQKIVFIANLGGKPVSYCITFILLLNSYLIYYKMIPI